MKTQCEVECIEICSGDRLIGYAIFFSGCWNVYEKVAGGRLLQFIRYYGTKEEAASYFLGNQEDASSS